MEKPQAQDGIEPVVLKKKSEGLWYMGSDFYRTTAWTQNVNLTFTLNGETRLQETPLGTYKITYGNDGHVTLMLKDDTL